MADLALMQIDPNILGRMKEDIMGLGIRGLAEFGLTLRTLKTLGQLQVDVEVALSPKMYDPRLIKLPRAARAALYRSLKKRSISHVLKIWPTQQVELRGDKDFPSSFKSTVAAKLIPALAKDKEIDWIELLRVPGRRKRRVTFPRVLSWFAVRALVAIEIEGQKKGMQTTEDRILLVKAYSEPDAIRRLRDEWKRYEVPGLIDGGYLHRWKKQKIVNTYKLFDSEINPKGTEINSRIDRNRMKPEYTWEPFKAPRNRMRRMP